MAARDASPSPPGRPEEQEVLGVNDRVQLAQVESACVPQVARELMLDGVTLIDPARVDCAARYPLDRTCSSM